MRALTRPCLKHLVTTCAFRRTLIATSEPSPILVRSHAAPHSGSIRILLLDRPTARNALSKRLVSDLRKHVDEIKAEGGGGSTRVLIIGSNADAAFCAGADLKERKGMTQEEYVTPVMCGKSLTSLEQRSSSSTYVVPSRPFQSYRSLPYLPYLPSH